MENFSLTLPDIKRFFCVVGIYEKRHDINEICCLFSPAYCLLTVTYCCLLLVVVVEVAQGQCSVA